MIVGGSAWIIIGIPTKLRIVGTPQEGAKPRRGFEIFPSRPFPPLVGTSSNGWQ